MIKIIVIKIKKNKKFKKEEIEPENIKKLYISAGNTGFFIFLSIVFGIFIFTISIKINDINTLYHLLFIEILYALNIYIISIIPEENFIKILLFTLIVSPLLILFPFEKIDIIYKTPIKLLHLGNVKITLILDKEYSKQLKKVLCKPQQNKALCNQLSNSFLQGFLLFRTPKGYLIKINKDSKNDSLFIKENFIKSYFFNK